MKHLALAIMLASAATHCLAQEQSPESASVHMQATYIAQRKPSFDAAYTGPNSLSPEAARSYSFTTTVFLAARPWEGGEAHADLEGVQGIPFSDMAGLGGFPNGELQKTAGPSLRWYRARLFLRQTFGFGGGKETLERDNNRIASEVDTRRFVVTAGNFAVTDAFDNNRFAHDPRSDFFNWSVMDSGAYDYAADARGYSWGIVGEWHDAGWSMRAGRFLVPMESNGLALDTRILRHYGDQVEIEWLTSMAGQEGKIRALVFRNVAAMGRYRDAIALGDRRGETPDLTRVRRRNSKVGAALGVEQRIARDVGVFMRLSMNDGGTEAYSFTEIDRSAAMGASVKGNCWGRGEDELGLALVRNGLSSAHREYLSKGGLGFFLGDGRLNYRPETIAEAYYSIRLAKAFTLTLDVQRVANPGYNADRGPVSVFGVRAHTEF